MKVERYKITSLDTPIPEMCVLRLEPVSGKIPPYKPGQFMFLHMLEGDKTIVRRAYSLASAPSAPYLEFAILLVKGQFTGRLEKMKVGDILGVEGPVGHMFYEGQRKAAFIGGGTGISPFISILRHIAENNIPGEFILFYSTRVKDWILFKDELDSMQKEHPGIKVVITLTRETGDWEGERGRICCPMILRHVKKPAEYDWFICGSPKLVKAMKECLEEAGADPKKLKMEGWG